MTPSDTELVGQAARGDDEALAALVARHVEAVRALCRRHAPDAAVDDAVQAVFLLLHRRAGSLTAHPCLRAWLLRAALHISRRARRSEQRRTRAEAQFVQLAPPGHAPDGLQLDRLDAALDRLSDQHRHAVILHVIEGESPATVATRLGVSRDHAYKLIQRGLDRLRCHLRPAGVGLPVGALVLAVAPPGTADETPTALLAAITRRPSPAARAMAHKELRRMLIRTFAPWLAGMAAACLACASLALAVEPQAEPPAPPIVAIDPVLDQRLSLVIESADAAGAIATVQAALPAALRLPWAISPGLRRITPTAVPSAVAVVLPSGATVRSALDAICAESGARWRMVAGVLCLERDMPGALPAADPIAGMAADRLEEVGAAIRAWLVRPEGNPLPSIANRAGQHWLGRAALAADPDLAARFLAAAPQMRSLLDDSLPDGPRALPAARAVIADARTEPSDLAAAAAWVERQDDAGDPAIYAVALARDPASWAALPLRRILVLRCGIAGRDALLGDGAQVVRPPLDGEAGLACLLGRGEDPAWRALLHAHLARPSDDPRRHAAEVVMALSPDPRTWAALVEAWTTAKGGDRARMGGAMLRCGARGRAALLEAWRLGRLSGEDLVACLEQAGEPTPAMRTLAIALAGDRGLPAVVRVRAAGRIFGPGSDQPEVLALGRSLLGDAEPLLRGTGLRLLALGKVAGPDESGIIATAERDPAPFVRASALALAWERERSNGSRPEEARRRLTQAAEDPHPQVRARAAALGLILLPPGQRDAALAQLRARENDATVLEIYDHRVRMTWQDGDRAQHSRWPQILMTGAGFPSWRDYDDEREATDQQRNLGRSN
ncbi:MAG: hypothetical protein RLZZ127_645 [Planctomycetota bacterium]